MSSHISQQKKKFKCPRKIEPLIAKHSILLIGKQVYLFVIIRKGEILIL